MGIETMTRVAPIVSISRAPISVPSLSRPISRVGIYTPDNKFQPVSAPKVNNPSRFESRLSLVSGRSGGSFRPFKFNLGEVERISMRPQMLRPPSSFSLSPRVTLPERVIQTVKVRELQRLPQVSLSKSLEQQAKTARIISERKVLPRSLVRIKIEIEEVKKRIEHEEKKTKRVVPKVVKSQSQTPRAQAIFIQEDRLTNSTRRKLVLTALDRVASSSDESVRGSDLTDYLPRHALRGSNIRSRFIKWLSKPGNDGSWEMAFESIRQSEFKDRQHAQKGLEDILAGNSAIEAVAKSSARAVTPHEIKKVIEDGSGVTGNLRLSTILSTLRSRLVRLEDEQRGLEQTYLKIAS